MGQLTALDLCCCQGGASAGLVAAGFRVIGVDIVPQPKYPYEFIQADALTFPLGSFDFIWASPPCQAYSNTQQLQGNEHPELIIPMRDRLKQHGAPYCIENVQGAPLEKPVMLCGNMFGLRTYRHRLFECSFPVDEPLHAVHTHPNRKMGRPVRDGEMMHIVGNFSGVARAKEIMGAPWMNRDGLREAIPPAYAEYIARAAIAHIKRKKLPWE